MRTMPAEVTPVNLAERIFVLLFMFFALSAFAVSVASLTQAYFKISERNRSFNDEMFAIRMHMHKLHVEDATQRRIKEYFTHLFNRRRIMAKEANVIAQLPPALKKEVENAQALQYVSRLSIIADFSKAAIKQICERSVKTDMLPEQQLCVAGHEANCAWILCAGVLTAKDINQIPQDISHDAVIDEDCLETEEPVYSQLSVVTATTCEVIRIDKETFADIACIHISDVRRRHIRSKNSARPDQVDIRGATDDTQSRTGAAVSATAVISS